MASLKGKRIAVFGLGRSGLAIAKAALKEGAKPVVYDEMPLDSIAKADLVQQAADLKIPTYLGSQGTFDPKTDLLVTNPAVDMRHEKLLDAVSKGIEVVSEIEFAYCIGKAPIIAITGTNGKSTTTLMTWEILKAAGQDAILCGNIYGTGYPEIPLTEAASNSTPDQVLVAEVSSFQLEWVKDFRPVAAGVTNITPDHLNRYDSFEQYAATKLRIFAAQTPADTAVIRANDPVVVPPRGPRVKTFGSAGEHAFAVGNTLIIGGPEVPVEKLPFEGVHNYLNAMLAGLLATSYMEGKDKPDEHEYVLHGLMNFKGLAHRMERLGERDGVAIINNSMCTNPDAVLKSCMSITRPMHILLGGENKDLDFSPLKALFDGSHNRGYAFGKAAKVIAKQAGGQISVHRTMQEAFDEALKHVLRGEVIILAPGCASTDQFKDFTDRGNVFKAMAKEWLEACLEH